MKTYHFSITIAGSGDDEDEAWRDATEGFMQEPGPTPDKENIELVDEEED